MTMRDEERATTEPEPTEPETTEAEGIEPGADDAGEAAESESGAGRSEPATDVPSVPGEPSVPEKPAADGHREPPEPEPTSPGVTGRGEPRDDAATEAVTGTETDQDTAAAGRRRLVDGLWPPRLTRAQLTVAALLFVLGLGLAIQVRSLNDDTRLRGARQEDLVRILDELDSRQQRLETELSRLEESRRQLRNSSDRAKEAREQTERRAAALGVLAGTARASGPGITLTVEDRIGAVRADMLLDTLQELRAAGAEAIEINGVRVVAGTYFTDRPSGGVDIDGQAVSAPYRFEVIGNPDDLQPALNIPGGVVRTLEKEQATVRIEEADSIEIDALRAPVAPDYSRSAPE